MHPNKSLTLNNLQYCHTVIAVKVFSDFLDRLVLVINVIVYCCLARRKNIDGQH